MSEHRLKTNKGDCGGNRERCSRDDCPIYGTLGKPGRDGRQRVRNCGDPSARGRRVRRQGKQAERAVRRDLGIALPTKAHAAIGEEAWGGAVRLEVKSGAQVKPIFTRLYTAEAQSEASRPFGDTRPFALSVNLDGDTAYVARKDGIIGLATELGMVWP